MKFNQPGKIGNVSIKNRIVMAPMISNLANPDGSINDNYIAYLERRAMGGVGMILTEYVYIDSLYSRGSRNEAGSYNFDFIPKFRRLTDRIHLHGSKVFIQLVHAGGKALISGEGSHRIAPSSIDYGGYRPDEMTPFDIDAVKSSFVRAAQFAQLANFDGIELHGAHGYLLQEFFSPALNRRGDEYGGNFEGRMRLAQEIINEIRDKVTIPVGIRLSLYEDDLNGYDASYGLMIASSLKKIDYVHFSAGRFAPPGSSASFYSPKTHIFDRLPQKPNLTTMVAGSVTNLDDIEKVLQGSDFVSIGRGLLADPYLVKKIEIDPQLVRPCIRCNQACRDLSYGEVRCTVNPDTGFELHENKNDHFTGDIVIAGAGIKGLEAAITAAKSGLHVTVYDRREKIGGQILDIFDEFKKNEFKALLSYYDHMINRLGIEFVPEKEYGGDGLYCYPDTVYPEIVPEGHILIDSNIYRYYDDALRLSENSRVTMTERSLLWLDRTRRGPYRSIAMQRGVEFVSEPDEKPDVSIIEKNQYDIRAAMVSGRESFRAFMERNRNDYL